MRDAFFTRVYVAVRRIPRGRVATYGQVAVLLGVPRGARAVGWALRALRGRTAHAVPCTATWGRAAASRSGADPARSCSGSGWRRKACVSSGEGSTSPGTGCSRAAVHGDQDKDTSGL